MGLHGLHGLQNRMEFGVLFTQSIDSIVFFDPSRRNHGKSMEKERLMILACKNLIHTKVEEMR